MLPDFTLTWTPYAKDGATLSGTLKWLQAKVAAPRGIDPALCEIAQFQVLSEVAQGKRYPAPCPCCNGQNAHTAIEHAMRDRLLTLATEQEDVQARIRSGMWQRAILEHIEADNAATLAEYGDGELEAELEALQPMGRFKKAWKALRGK
jgi:hypothetical protein